MGQGDKPATLLTQPICLLKESAGISTKTGENWRFIHPNKKLLKKTHPNPSFCWHPCDSCGSFFWGVFDGICVKNDPELMNDDEFGFR